MVFILLASFHFVGGSLKYSVVDAIDISGFHTNALDVQCRQNFWVGDQFDFVNLARLYVEHEGNLDRSGVNPSGAEFAIDGDRYRPPGAVESSSHRGCAVV